MNTRHDMKTKSDGSFMYAFSLLGVATASFLATFLIGFYIDKKTNCMDTREWECKTKMGGECVTYKKKGMDFDGHGIYRHRKYDQEQGTLLYPKEKAQ